jgi:hypothetical protein
VRSNSKGAAKARGCASAVRAPCHPSRARQGAHCASQGNCGKHVVERVGNVQVAVQQRDTRGAVKASGHRGHCTRGQVKAPQRIRHPARHVQHCWPGVQRQAKDGLKLGTDANAIHKALGAAGKCGHCQARRNLANQIVCAHIQGPRRTGHQGGRIVQTCRSAHSVSVCRSSTAHQGGGRAIEKDKANAPIPVPSHKEAAVKGAPGDAPRRVKGGVRPSAIGKAVGATARQRAHLPVALRLRAHPL